MKIAFIEFEYPPDTARGGIAGYTWEAATGLVRRGHHVEVFAGARDRTGNFEEEGVVVHRVTDSPQAFTSIAGCAFKAVHQTESFDVLEGAELTAPAREAVRLIPDIPLVVRLHGPSFKLRTMSLPAVGLAKRARVLVGALRRGKRPYWRTQPVDERERRHLQDADVIAASSSAVGELVRRKWRIASDRIVFSPLPFFPNESLLSIPAGGNSGVVTFVGHLGIGKGVAELAQAIPMVLRENGDLKFRLIGHIGQSPSPGQDMREFVVHHCGEFRHRVEIPGPVPRRELGRVLEETEIFVLPSHWDTFPMACLEAMAAGRAIVGSTSGGMPEMLDEGQAGVLVPPFKPALLARAIGRLAGNLDLRKELGERARRRLGECFCGDKSLAILETCYELAMARRRAAGARSCI